MNVTQQLFAPPPPPPLQELQMRLNQAIRYYTQEQIRLYFFPFPERQHKELWKLLMRWVMSLAGLFVLLIIVYFSLVAPQQGLTATGIFGSLLSASLVILIVWLTAKYVVPLVKRYNFEYKEHVKEQQHIAQNRPPSDEEYRNWINFLGSIIYAMAVEKLHLPETKEYKEWKEWKGKTGENNGIEPKKWGYSADLQIRGFEAPSEDKNYILRMAKRDKQDVAILTSENELDAGKPLRRGTNYSINSFTRLFVTKDFITIYRNVINVRQPERILEKSEHIYHQHLTHVSLEIDSQMIGNTKVTDQCLTLTLDSGNTIPLNVASATFFYKGSKETDVDGVHGGLIDALHEHKLSTLYSITEAKKAEDVEYM